MLALLRSLLRQVAVELSQHHLEILRYLLVRLPDDMQCLMESIVVPQKGWLEVLDFMLSYTFPFKQQNDLSLPTPFSNETEV